MNQYLNRVLIGLVLFAFAFAFSYFNAIIYSLVVLTLSLLTVFEFKALMNKMGIYPVYNLISFFNTIFILLPLLLHNHYQASSIYVFQVCILISAYVVIFSRILLKTTTIKFEDIAVSLWAVLHLGLLPSFYVWLRIMDHGFAYVFTIIISISANDVGCLLFGKLFGKEKLAPEISPSKTVAGSIGGLICGSLAFLGSIKIFHLELIDKLWIYDLALIENLINNFGQESFTLVLVIALGLLISVVAQIGDLLVSVLKRAAGVKDTGTLLSSHGGVLDRVDSHFFAAWFAFFVFSFFLH